MTTSRANDDAVLEEAAGWLVQLNDSTATEADFVAWQAWLGEHPAHAQAFQELEDTWRRSAAVSLASASRLQELRHETGEPRRFFERPVARWAAAAVVTLALAGGTYVLYRGEVTTLQTATAELRSVRLPDGSRAALGPETNVQIAYSEGRRALRMTAGEAYFEVAHAPGRPFSVDTPAGRVIAVGTAFAVNISGQRIAVSVTEGSVRVEPPMSVAGTEDSAARPTIVGAGHRFVREAGETRAAAFVPSVDALAWRQGRLEYQGEPLRVVVSDINRYSLTKLRIADATLGELRYTGTVFPDSIELWLSSIEGVFPLRVTERQGERVIVRADP